MPEPPSAPENSENPRLPDGVRVEPVPELPLVEPPTTKTPVQFNQQVNVYQQIPQSAWDRLSPEQVVELSKVIVQQLETIDKRQFDFAMEQTKSDASGRRTAVVCGSVIAVLGFGATAYLGMNGHEIIALSVSLPLATILAMIVGNRFLG